MENATKALMIAGAVLIAILIISVGMMIFSQGDSVIKGSQGKIDQVAVQAFNSAYDSYEGDQKGSALKQLISTVISSNATYEGTQDDKVISVKVGTSEAAKDSKGLSTARASLVAGKAYTVSFDYNTSGYINVINIVEKTENNKNGLK